MNLDEIWKNTLDMWRWVSEQDMDVNLAKSISSHKFLNRETLGHLIQIHCPKRQKLLLKYGDIYYYLSGSLFKDAFPILHPEAATLCREEVSHVVHSNLPDRTQCRDIWHDVIDAWGVTYSAIHRLPLAEIVNIRRDSIGKRVRKTWHE